MRGEERRGENTREDKRREKIHFQCGGAWPCFVDVVIFWLIPFAHETCACYTVSSTIHFRFQCILAGQQFFNICEIIILYVTVCSFFSKSFLLVMQLQFQNFQSYLVIQLQCIFAGINSA